MTTTASISVFLNISLNRIQESNITCDITMLVPSCIRERCCKKHSEKSPSFTITSALRRSKVRAFDFKKYWRMVQTRTPDDELVELLKNVTGAHSSLSGKVNFIQDILRRYKAMGEPVCVFGMPACCLSVCSVSSLGHVVM